VGKKVHAGQRRLISFGGKGSKGKATETKGEFRDRNGAKERLKTIQHYSRFLPKKERGNNGMEKLEKKPGVCVGGKVHREV